MRVTKRPLECVLEVEGEWTPDADTLLARSFEEAIGEADGSMIVIDLRKLRFSDSELADALDRVREAVRAGRHSVEIRLPFDIEHLVEAVGMIESNEQLGFV